MTGISASILGGYCLDLVAGEPPNAWHPVRWMGKVIDLADWAVPGRERGARSQRVAGAVVAVGLPVGTHFLCKKFLASLPRPLAGVASAALLSTAVASHSLYEQARRVENGLVRGLDEGREAAAHMVGRDTDGLDEGGVVRAAVESIAENANDGVIAPLFYGIIGGVPLALAYRMVNTLDSMIGYRDEQYLYFGWGAARLDDIAGFVPARLTALSAAALSPLVGGLPEEATALWRRDAGLHESPNAGVCESAYAGALRVRLGGTNYYGGIPVKKLAMGEEYLEPELEDIGRAARLMCASSALVLSAGLLVRISLAAARFVFNWRRG